MRKYIKYLTALSLIAGLFFFQTPTTHAFEFFSNDKNSSSVCPAKQGSASSSVICQAPQQPDNPVIKAIQTATGVVALLAGVLAVIMIIVGGFTMITSAGNEEAVKNSKKRITSSLIGLIIVALAWIIIRIITDQIIR